MNHGFLARRVGAMVVGVAAITAFVAGSAQAATTPPIDTSACSNPLLTQPFLSSRDSNWYTLIPGQTPGNFDGTGWQFSGGARIITTTLADGSTSSVLDLPSGSQAVSPTMCVTSAYPTARAMVRDVKGSDGVFFYVSYEGTSTWTNPKNTGQVHGQQTAWTLATPVNVQPSNTSGWQPVRFTFVPGGNASDFQLYNIYIDPHCRM
jgi:hypothetical protein